MSFPTFIGLGWQLRMDFMVRQEIQDKLFSKLALITLLLSKSD
jgi:hypothetical protein